MYDSITVEEEPGVDDVLDNVGSANSSFSEATDEDQVIDDGLEGDELGETGVL